MKVRGKILHFCLSLQQSFPHIGQASPETFPASALAAFSLCG